MESIQTNFTVFSALATIVIAILLGINAAMTFYFLRKGGTSLSKGGFLASVGGLRSGIVGIGCVACGSIVLLIIGAAAFMIILPLKGKEFDILSIGLLVTSITVLARKIRAPVIYKPVYSDP